MKVIRVIRIGHLPNFHSKDKQMKDSFIHNRTTPKTISNANIINSHIASVSLIKGGTKRFEGNNEIRK